MESAATGAFGSTALGARVRWIAVGAGALAFGIGLVLFRGEPVAAGDQGVFLSVAARVLDGDRLYADAVENKDPLFFYTYAAGLWIGGWRGAFFLDGIWLAVAAIGSALLLRELRVARAAVVAGFFVYPLALTSGWYVAGHTMLAGLAFAPLAAWLWLRRSFAASGAVLAVVILFKMHVGAVAAAPLVAFFLLGAPTGGRLRPLVRATAGFAGTFGFAALLLALRGELGAYLDTITYNVYYSRALLQSETFLGRAQEHLDIVLGYFERAGRWQLPATVLVLGLFVAAAVYLVRRRASPERLLAATAAVTLLLTVGTLALTAYWFHHNQMLAYPAMLMTATLIVLTAVTLDGRAAGLAAAACVLFALWSSAKNEDRLEISPAWTAAPVSAGATALENARVRFWDPSERVTYMVFGGNSENAHAVFISDELDLACRWFHLYPHSTDEQLDETTECSEREDPQLVLVTLGFFDSRADESEWGEFVRSARRLLDSEYRLVETQHPGFEVWKRNERAAA